MAEWEIVSIHIIAMILIQAVAVLWGVIRLNRRIQRLEKQVGDG